jgi:hypothetical protein
MDTDEGFGSRIASMRLHGDKKRKFERTDRAVGGLATGGIAGV